jgi:two-component system cell cycle sensor histidine kinase/response regulator CckA
VSTILLVEDEPAILDLMSVVLEPSGHVILKASTLEEAMKRFDETDGNIDLLIADVNLPGTSGIRVALELRSLLPNLAIVLTSGYTPDMWNATDVIELNELPSESIAVLQKPFLPATLFQLVSRFAGSPLRPGMALAKAS